MNALQPPSPTDLSLVLPIVALAAIVGFLGVIAAYRSRTHVPPPAPKPQPCYIKGHAYRPYNEGWCCLSCGDTVHVHGVGTLATSAPVPVGAAAG